MATTSYGLMFGTLIFSWADRPDPTRDPYGQINGCFNTLPQIRLAAITDGLSSTAFASERAMSFINTNRIGPYGEWTETENAATLLYSWNPSNSVFRDWSRSGYRSSLLPSMLASSRHPSGVNVLFGDRSVRFVRDTVNSWPLDPLTLNPSGLIQWVDVFKNVPTPGVWQALTTRSGNEIVDSTSF